MILTHYFHREDKPFQTLSSLSEDEALCAIAGLKNRTGLVYRRFTNPQQYLQQRRETEQWVRQAFIQKGGMPIYPYPQYFTVERSLWIEEGFDGQSASIQIPLSAFDPGQVSFTYPDSMISHWLRGQTDKAFHYPDYHGQVFTSSEICEIVSKYGIPDTEWRIDSTRKYDLFIEAQVWSAIPGWEAIRACI